jgi:hypothetical protein
VTPERQRLQSFLDEEVQRYLDEIRHQTHESPALKNVCHVVLWACALDEFLERSLSSYTRLRDTHADGGYLKGMRFARNRALHQFPNLIDLFGGGAFPLLFPQPFFEYYWKPVHQLPPPDPKHAKKNAKLERFYAKYLAQQPVRFTFAGVQNFFASVP